MLSVLIPVFNKEISELAETVCLYCKEAGIEYEVIAVDDCSDNPAVRESNSRIKSDYFSLIELDNNVGNAEARNILARKAVNDWLLFLDADMIPVREDFIKRYLEEISKDDFDVMSGGILYERKNQKEYSLKLLHGEKTEEQIAGKDPYLEIRGNNFLIRKSTFLENPFGGLPENYGYVDTHFGLKLKKADARVRIIDNPCYHLGLETNERFVKKFRKAVRNAFWLYHNDREMAENLKIVRYFKILKSLRLTALTAFLFRRFEPNLLRNLLSDKPSLFLFQLYKLGYMCTLKAE